MIPEQKRQLEWNMLRAEQYGSCNAKCFWCHTYRVVILVIQNGEKRLVCADCRRQTKSQLTH